MANVKRISVEEARKLLAEGYVYVDVRSEPEFEEGHVPGAFNVPLMHRGPTGMTANPDFLSVMEAAFQKQEKLILGCRSGNRSLRAATVLLDAGFENVVELRPGWDGARDAFGRVEPGWSRQGLPVERDLPEAQTYEGIKRRSD